MKEIGSPRENEQQGVTQRLYFIRHAKKETTGELTQEGKNDSVDYFRRVLRNERITNLQIFHSPISRSKSTAEIIASNVPDHIKKTLGEVESLTEHPYTDENIERYGLSGGLWLEEENPTDMLPPTKLLATNIANIILARIDSLQIQTENSNESSIYVSHMPPLMLFLRHYFEKELRLKKGAVLEGLGGFLKPLHGYTIDIHKTRDKKVQLKLTFEKLKNGQLELLDIPFDEGKLRN